MRASDPGDVRPLRDTRDPGDSGGSGDSGRSGDGAPPGPDPRLRTAIVAVALVGVGFTVAALAIFGLRTALSVAVGAGLAVGNLWALARIIGALLPSTAAGARGQSRAGWALVAILKMFALVGAVWLLMRHGVVSAMPMVVGFGSLPIGIAIGSLVSDRSAPADPPET